MPSSAERKNPNSLRRVERRVNELTRTVIKVGWSTEMGASSEDVEIAIYNALGTDTIPARPTLETTMERERAYVLRENAAIVRTVSRDRPPDPLLERLAAHLENEQTLTVLALRDPPNAPSTIKQKGFDDPLVGAGEMGGRIAANVAGRVFKR